MESIEKKTPKLTDEQKAILDCDKKNLIVSASAGSGKTFVVIEYLKKLVCEKKIPLSKMLVLTFTKAAAGEMKSRLMKALLESPQSDFLSQQLDELPLSDISTIHAFCEKLLKQYASLVSLSQNFIVLDEKQSLAIKNRAFLEAFEHFSQSDDEDFNVFYNAFKKNKDLMLENIENFASYLESQKEGDSLAEEFALNYQIYRQRAEKFLNDYLKSELIQCEHILREASFEEMEEDYSAYGEEVLNALQIKLTDDFAQNCQTFLGIKLSRMPTKKTQYLTNRELLTRAKDRLKELVKLAENYSSYGDVFRQEENNNHVAKALVKLFYEYRKNYSALKGYKNALDFSDLERKAQTLLEREEILNDLQQKYSYIFVDEYQDTNPLQENFVKAVAGKGNFVAVGDPKQGIYGFRNASMEIMKNDISEFSKADDGDALYLNGNFRSDNHILQFVNNIFDCYMNEKSVGIDYARTSRLKGLADFKGDGFKPVEVDVILPPKDQPVIKKGVYSVKNDSLGFEDKNLLEVMTIASHIEKYLAGRIYDAKTKEFRNVSEGDIVVLFRKRSPLMERLASYLERLGYNVDVDNLKPLLDNGEIASIVSFIRLALSLDDEVALASGLLSAIGGFSVEEISSFKGSREKSFKDNVLSSNSAKVCEFFDKLNAFKTNINILGLTEALNRLLDESFHDVYLASLDNGYETKQALNNLFSVIKSGDFDFNLQGLLDFLDEKKPGGKGEGNSNAITLTTIHATKGLEYPIVILAGCGDNMGKPNISSINFSNSYGLGTNLYDFENNIKVPSLAKLANRISRQRKDFIDELMIFYVALTRAKNHLVLTGTLSADGLKKLYLNKTYLSLVLNSYGEKFADAFLELGQIEKEDVLFNLIESGEEEILQNDEKIEKVRKVNAQEVKDYINFIYPDENAGLAFKRSVTSLMEDSLNKENTIYEKKAEEKTTVLREDAIESGNAYHEALKVLPFSEINSESDIDRLLNKDMLSEGYYEKIDKQLLLKNILIIKDVVKGGQVYKEREFISSCTLKELEIKNSDDKIIVQGIIDLFSLGDKNILIDYKYTSQKNPEKIKEKYLSQVKLYEKALEKAFNKKIDEKYILSLKEAKLIKID